MNKVAKPWYTLHLSSVSACYLYVLAFFTLSSFQCENKITKPTVSGNQISLEPICYMHISASITFKIWNPPAIGFAKQFQLQDASVVWILYTSSLFSLSSSAYIQNSSGLTLPWTFLSIIFYFKSLVFKIITIQYFCINSKQFSEVFKTSGW